MEEDLEKYVKGKIIIYFSDRAKPFCVSIVRLLSNFNIQVHSFVHVPAIPHNGVRSRKLRKK